MDSTDSQSKWKSRLRAMGPGILMASAAVGGSHRLLNASWRYLRLAVGYYHLTYQFV